MAKEKEKVKDLLEQNETRNIKKLVVHYHAQVASTSDELVQSNENSTVQVKISFL